MINGKFLKECAGVSLAQSSHPSLPWKKRSLNGEHALRPSRSTKFSDDKQLKLEMRSPPCLPLAALPADVCFLRRGWRWVLRGPRSVKLILR